MSGHPASRQVAQLSAEALGLELDAESVAYEAEQLTSSADGRHVVRYRFRDVAGRHLGSAVAKSYPDAEGAATYRAMVALAALISPSGPLEVPQALSWDGELRLLVMADVPGRTYREVMCAPEPAAPMRRVGRALATLHGLPLAAGWPAPRGMAEHASELARPAPDELARVRPQDAELVRAIYADALAQEPFGVRPTMLHRDFHPGQLVERGERVAVLDWDAHAVGDPALDLANLLVYLETRLGDAAGPVQDAVREGYASAGDPAVLERVAPFAALTYLRMAAKRHRLGTDGGPLPVNGLLSRARAQLTLMR